MAGAPKVVLTGLKIVPNPHAILETVYHKMLKGLNKLPEDYVYRQCTEKIVLERLDIIKKCPDREEATAKLGVKYMEELISQARTELGLIKRMAKWKPWENLVEEAPEDQWKWPPNK